MTHRRVDAEAEALLVAVVERSGGDIRIAFAILCGCVTLDDITGEPFEAALARAVTAYFGRPGIAQALAGPTHETASVDA